MPRQITHSERIHGEFFSIKDYVKKICEKKNWYRCEGEAIRMAKKLRRIRGEHLHAYFCDSCGRWHLGHDSIDRKIENDTQS